MKTRQKIRKGLILFSFFLFPAIFYYLSPFLILQASSKGIVNGSFVLFVLMFISALFLGRSYCGWLCPGAGCQEAIFDARDKKVIVSSGYSNDPIIANFKDNGFCAAIVKPFQLQDLAEGISQVLTR